MRRIRQRSATRLAHRGREGVKGVHHSRHVDVEDFAKDRDVVSLLGEGAMGDPRIGDDNVRDAVPGHEIGGRSLQGRQVPHVERIGLGLSRQGVAQLLENIAPARDESQDGTFR